MALLTKRKPHSYINHNRINNTGKLEDEKEEMESTSRITWKYLLRNFIYEKKYSIMDWRYPSIACMAGIVVFINTIYCEFAWDDRAAILYNRDVYSPVSLKELFSHDYWGTPITSFDSHKSFRPITVMSFRLNYILHGHSPGGYHFMNLIIHGVNCYLVVVCGNLIIGSSNAGLFGGLLFAVHPIHCDAVASVVGRADILCTMICLISIRWYMIITHPMKTHWKSFACVLVLVILASLSKELGVATFGIFIALEYQYGCVILDRYKKILRPTQWTFKNFWKYHTIRSYIYYIRRLVFASRMVIFRTLIILILGGSFIVKRVNLHGSQLLYRWTVLENDVSLLPNATSKFLSYAHIHSWYLWKLFWPKNLCYDYGFKTIPTISSWTDPLNAYTCIAYIMVLILVIYSIKYSLSPVFMLTMVGVMPFIPVSNIFFPVGTIFAERLLYYPSVGFCLLVGYFVEYLLKIIPEIKYKDSYVSILKYAIQFGAIVILLLCCWKTINRNSEWLSERTLYESGANVNPNSVKVLNNYAKVLLTPEEVNKSIPLLEKALTLFPGYFSCHLNLGVAYRILGKTLHSIKHYHTAIKIQPENPDALGYLGQELLAKWQKEVGDGNNGNPELLSQAMNYLNKSIEFGCSTPAVIQSRGLAAFYEEDYDGAVKYLGYSIQMSNDLAARNFDLDRIINTADSYNMMAFALANKGNDEESLRVYEYALNQFKDQFILYNNAAVQYSKLGFHERAIQLYEMAMELQPENGILASNLGYAAERSGKLSLAKEWYERAYKLDPSHPQIIANLENLKKLLSQ